MSNADQAPHESASYPAAEVNQRTRPSGKVAVGVFIIDVLLVILFAVIGRSSHGESLSVPGVAETAWPFLAGLVVAWLVGRVWRAPYRIWPHGICVWLITVVAGMLLRLLIGQTAQLPFVIVTALVLAVFLLGQRGIQALVARSRERRRRPESELG